MGNENLLEISVKDFLAATAAKQPAPGGGAVAALCGALAASLGAMALEYTVGRKAYAEHDAEIRQALVSFQTTSMLLQELIAEDAAAYEALVPLLKLSPEEREKNGEFLPAVVAAIRAPQTVAGFAGNILEQCRGLLEKTNKHLISDLGIAAIYAHATVHASELNVRVNLPLLPNQGEAAELRQNLSELVGKADKTYELIRTFMLKTL